MFLLNSLLSRQSAEKDSKDTPEQIQPQQQNKMVKKIFLGLIIKTEENQDNDWLMNSITQKVGQQIQPQGQASQFRIFSAVKDTISLSILIHNMPKINSINLNQKKSFVEDVNFIILAIQPKSFTLSSFRKTITQILQIRNNFLLIMCIRKHKEKQYVHNKDLEIVKQNLKQEVKFLQVQAYNHNHISELKNFILYYFYKKSQYSGMTFYNPKYSLNFHSKIQQLFLLGRQDKRHIFFEQAMKIYKQRLLQLGEDPLMILFGNKILQNLQQKEIINQTMQKELFNQGPKQQAKKNKQEQKQQQVLERQKQLELDFDKLVLNHTQQTFKPQEKSLSKPNVRYSGKKSSVFGNKNLTEQKDDEQVDSFIDIIDKPYPFQISQEQYELLLDDLQSSQRQQRKSQYESGMSFSQIWLQKIKIKKDAKKQNK